MARHSASAVTRAPPAKAAGRILSPAGMESWWIGKLTIGSVDADWPSVGSRMRWRAGGGTFEAEVSEQALPHKLVMRVRTPSGESTITHTFEATPEGGTRYEKVVDARPNGLFGKLFDPMLASFVKREVKRAAEDATERA